MKQSLYLSVSAVLVVAASSAMTFAAPCPGNSGNITQVAAEQPTIVEAAASNADFSTLVAAVKAAGLVETLQGEGPFTVFAPTNKAFSKLPKGTVDALLKPENKKKLVNVLTYHVVPGAVYSDQAVTLNAAKSVQGTEIPLEVVDGELRVDGAKVVKADIGCANGVIHVIDSVILPADIVETAAGNENFSTLVAAVKAAGLVDTLKGDGPFTVFAPTNDAFAKLPEGTVQNLLKPENRQQLVDILTYHVVPGRVMAKDVVKLKEAETAFGKTIPISTDAGGVQVGRANVVKTDIGCGNGVIHVIDSVLMP